ncbi:MAG: hypothetical protein WA183_17340, partial [Chthoniobacterales bacterium]
TSVGPLRRILFEASRSFAPLGRLPRTLETDLLSDQPSPDRINATFLAAHADLAGADDWL